MGNTTEGAASLPVYEDILLSALGVHRARGEDFFAHFSSGRQAASASASACPAAAPIFARGRSFVFVPLALVPRCISK